MIDGEGNQVSVRLENFPIFSSMGGIQESTHHRTHEVLIKFYTTTKLLVWITDNTTYQ